MYERYENEELPGVYNPIQSLLVGFGICALVTVNGLPAVRELGVALKLTPLPPVTLKAPLVVPINPGDDAVNVYPNPAWLILRSLKLTTPPATLFVVVPLTTAPVGLAPIATVTAAVDEGAVFPKLSRTTTVGGPGIVFPAVAFPGCVMKANAVTAPGSTVSGALSPALSISPLMGIAVITTPLSAFV
jgi:hypothetical protein